MATDLQSLINNTVANRYNPNAIARGVVDLIDVIGQGNYNIPDASNPFMMGVEAAACMAAACMQQNDINTRLRYPVLAQTQEEIYPHMSDIDYIGRFASPATAKITFGFALEELIDKLVLDNSTGIRKIVIPRNTFVTVANVVFSLQYPIEIRQMAHGGLQVVYDADITSPLQELAINVITPRYAQNQAGEFMFLDLDMMQFSIVSQSSTANAGTDFSVDIPFDDQFCFARVYTQNADSTFTEIPTTHSLQVYDAATPTAVLKVVGQSLNISLPQVYTSTGLVSRAVRMDVYQTKGPMSMVLHDYLNTAFVATWKNYDANDDTIFSAPMKTLNSFVVFSNDVVNGGAAALAFPDLRTRVIQNSVGPISQPITPIQAQLVLQRKGYDIVKVLDNITGRAFLATRLMPTPTQATLLTAAASSIQTVAAKLTDFLTLTSVIDNGSRITITPDTLYKVAAGITLPVPSSEVSALMALPAEKRALIVSSNNYLFTPFHYVLDTTLSEFEARAYFLDDPEVVTKNFIMENDATLLQVSTDTYYIARISSGYALRVTTTSSDDFKELADADVHVQLAYIPTGERDRAYLNGTLIGMTDANERIYEFDLSTSFDVDAAHNLSLLTFQMFTPQFKLTRSPLEMTFDILFSTSAPMPSQWSQNTVDSILGNFLLPNRIAGITHETLDVRFGSTLSTLWKQARSMASTAVYRTYTSDVPAVYTQDVFQRDANGLAVTIGSDHKPKYSYLHRAGDVQVDAQNNIIYAHREGDVMFDPAGRPIVLNPRDMTRAIDMMLIEGAYWFANDGATVGYKKELTDIIVKWLTEDLAIISQELLEETRIYFYPKTTLGTVQVMVGAGQKVFIEAGQSFEVTYAVSKLVNNDLVLKAKIESSTISTLAEQLTGSIVSIDSMTDALRAVNGNDIKSVAVTGLGGTANYQVMTMLDDTVRCSIRKQLVAAADDSLYIQPAVVVNFVLHELNAVA